MEEFEININNIPDIQTEVTPEADQYLWSFLKSSALANISFFQYYDLSSDHRFFISHEFLVAVTINTVISTEYNELSFSSFYDLLVFSYEEVEYETETVLSIIHEAAMQNSLIRAN